MTLHTYCYGGREGETKLHDLKKSRFPFWKFIIIFPPEATPLLHCLIALPDSWTMAESMTIEVCMAVVWIKLLHTNLTISWHKVSYEKSKSSKCFTSWRSVSCPHFNSVSNQNNTVKHGCYGLFQVSNNFTVSHFFLSVMKKIIMVMMNRLIFFPLLRVTHSAQG